MPNHKFLSKNQNIDRNCEEVVFLKTMFQGPDVRLLLTWSHDPLDLDSRLKFFDANGDEVCELYWRNKNCDDYATLDVDETNVSIQILGRFPIKFKTRII